VRAFGNRFRKHYVQVVQIESVLARGSLSENGRLVIKEMQLWGFTLEVMLNVGGGTKDLPFVKQL